jgi:hypothetical protein
MLRELILLFKKGYRRTYCPFAFHLYIIILYFNDGFLRFPSISTYKIDLLLSMFLFFFIPNHRLDQSFQMYGGDISKYNI